MSAFTVGPYGMVAVLPVYVALALISYFLTPKKLKKSPIAKVCFVIFHALGLLSLLSMTIWFCYIEDGILKQLHLIWQTFYFIFILMTSIFLGLFSIVNLLRKLIKRKGNYKPLNNIYVWWFSVIFSCVFIMAGFYHNNTIQDTKYEVQSHKPSTTQTMKIAMYSDSHTGAGASKQTISDCTNRFNSYGPDIVILDGDIVDGSTSTEDLEFLTSTLKNTKSNYGIYFVWGNHDDNCLFDWEKALTDAGVIILKDQAVQLPNGTFLVGCDDRTKTDPTTILESSGYAHAQFDYSEVIVAKHRPKYFERFKDQCDVMLCGHTHGYLYPICFPTTYIDNDMIYGIKTYDNFTAITTSGLSTWGFYTKFPSYSETVEVTINYAS